MSNLTQAINDFIQTISTEHGVGRAQGSILDEYLRACLMGEYTLRCLFATDRENPLVKSPYIGLFDAFDLPFQATLAQPRDWDMPETEFIWHHQGTDYKFPQKHILSVKPELRRNPGDPTMVIDRDRFHKALEVFSGEILSSIANWDNIMVAGGSVLACLTYFEEIASIPLDHPDFKKKLFNIFQSHSYQKSDIDLFLWGMNEAQAKEKMQEIFQAIASAAYCDVVCFRTNNTITIQAEYPKRPIQIIMRLYNSPAEILCGFDVDCCCVGYNGTNLWMNPRALAAIVRQCNTIDLMRRSPSYEHRLAKYSTRGYEVFYPDLDRAKIDYDSLIDPDRNKFPNGLGRLIVYEVMAIDYQLFPQLYAESGERFRPAPVPVGDLRPSNYDYAWVKIPHGPKWWEVKNVKAHVEEVGRKIIEAISSENRRLQQGVMTHYHVVTCGTMEECLKRCCDPPVHNTLHQTRGVLANGLFRGPATFIVDNPGRQTIGSFNPINSGSWESDAYFLP